MRDASFAVIREIGVETGESNIQFAVNPENERVDRMEFCIGFQQRVELLLAVLGQVFRVAKQVVALPFDEIALGEISFPPSKWRTFIKSKNTCGKNAQDRSCTNPVD